MDTAEFFCSALLLFALNLYVIRSPRANALLTALAAGLVSPPITALFAGYILLSFGEPLATTVAVIAPIVALILLLGWVEVIHLDYQKIEATFHKNKNLRKLPNGMLAYDHYWDWDWGKNVKIPGFGWRIWFDRAVLAVMILAMPIGATAAFTSKGNMFNIPPQWGMATTALLLSLLLRPIITSCFGLLAFLRYLQR